MTSFNLYKKVKTSTCQKYLKCCLFTRLLTKSAALWWVCHIPPCISFSLFFCYQKKRLCKKSALAFEVNVSQIPVFCCQTGFSSASMNFYQTKTVCFSAASLLFAKDTLDSMVLNEASFGLICLHVSIVACFYSYISLVSLSNKWWKNSISSTWLTKNK